MTHRPHSADGEQDECRAGDLFKGSLTVFFWGGAVCTLAVIYMLCLCSQKGRRNFVVTGRAAEGTAVKGATQDNDVRESLCVCVCVGLIISQSSLSVYKLLGASRHVCSLRVCACVS